jgi:hypothetical protein
MAHALGIALYEPVKLQVFCLHFGCSFLDFLVQVPIVEIMLKVLYSPLQLFGSMLFVKYCLLNPIISLLDGLVDHLDIFRVRELLLFLNNRSLLFPGELLFSELLMLELFIEGVDLVSLKLIAQETKEVIEYNSLFLDSRKLLQFFRFEGPHRLDVHVLLQVIDHDFVLFLLRSTLVRALIK